MARDVSIDKTRNIGIMAHIDAGKTTTTERILYLGGNIHKIGETHDGESQMDWMDQEKERGITITSAATTVHWNGYRFNIIDTPGHVDFTIEVARSLRVLDGAIALIDAQAGVETQTEQVWRQANDYKVPRMICANKMTKVGADFYYSIDSIHNRLANNAEPIMLPIGKEDHFDGFVDLVTMKAYKYDGTPAQELTEIDIPADMVSEAEEYRGKLIEAVADYSDELMEAYLEGNEISVDLLKSTIRKATIDVKFFPILCADALDDKGTRAMMDAVIDYLPAPTDIDDVKGIDLNDKEVTRKASDNEPFSALAFKVMNDPFVGNLTFFRVYSGVLKSGSYVMNSTNGEKERIGRILQMHANQRKEIQDPEPVIELAIEPKSKADQEKMSLALQKLAKEDPSFRAKTDHETGQTIIAGMGELHLDVLVDRMKREFGVEANVGKPQVAYRETLRQAAECEGKYIKQSGGRGQYGHVWVKFEPNKDKGYEFVDEVVGGVVPREYIPVVDKGLQEALAGGVLAGYPMIDVKCTLFDGSYHDVDSNEMAFKIAASMALKEAKNKCNPCILEPIMLVDVRVPDEFMGTVMGDLTSRRGKPLGNESIGKDIDIKAMVPLSEMFGYMTVLRSNTQGRGTYQMIFDHYEEVPKNIAEEIIKKNGVE